MVNNWVRTPTIPEIGKPLPTFNEFQAQQRPLVTGWDATPGAPSRHFAASGGGAAGADPGAAKLSLPGPEETTVKPNVATAAAVDTGGTFGTVFKDPGGGWNPWSLYDGRDGFDGSAADGYYDATRDRPKWELAGRGLEKDRDRVWRWTLDALGANPGGQSPDRVKAVFLEQVARLKRDYLANGMDWASSPFAGYDRLAVGGGGQPTPTVGEAQPAVTNPAAAGGGQQPGGGAPAGGAGVPGAGGGGAGGALATTQRQYLIDDPDYALKYMLKQRGIDVDQKGLVGSYLRSKYLNPLKAAIAATGLGTGGSQLGDIESVLAQFGAGLQGTGNELENLLHGISQRAFDNPALNDLSDEDLMALTENLGFLGTFGSNPYIASARKNQYDDVRDAFGDVFFGGLAGGDVPSFQEFMRTRGFRPY